VLAQTLTHNRRTTASLTCKACVLRFMAMLAIGCKGIFAVSGLAPLTANACIISVARIRDKPPKTNCTLWRVYARLGVRSADGVLCWESCCSSPSLGNAAVKQARHVRYGAAAIARLRMVRIVQPVKMNAPAIVVVNLLQIPPRLPASATTWTVVPVSLCSARQHPVCAQMFKIGWSERSNPYST